MGRKAMTKHRVVVAGASGRMGRAVVEAVSAADDMEFVGGAGRSDDLAAVIERVRPTVLVDFTVPEAVLDHIRIGLAAGIPMVVGTTGLTADDVGQVDEEARRRGVGLVIEPNFSLGAVLMARSPARRPAGFLTQKSSSFIMKGSTMRLRAPRCAPRKPSPRCGPPRPCPRKTGWSWRRAPEAGCTRACASTACGCRAM